MYKNKLNKLTLQEIWEANNMQFKDIIGHSEAIQKLKEMADRKMMPHALLLHGPSGIGKHRLARAFISYLNCKSHIDSDSCGHCPACVQTASFNNPDIHYIYPVIKKNSPSRNISSDYAEEWTDYVRNHSYMPEEEWLSCLDAGNSRPIIYVAESEEILRLSSLSTYGAGYKIFLIWQPEKMSSEAANKLLKVIEEPFEDTLFIFVSDNPGEILPTIRSRLQTIEMKALTEDSLTDFFMNSGKTAQEARSLAKIAKGNMNRAHRLIENDGELHEFTTLFITVMRACYGRKMVELKGLADSFASFGREKSLRLLDYFARMVRESFISNLHIESLQALTPEEISFVEKFGPFINASNIEEISSQIDRAANDISRNANQKIVWFDFLIELCRLIRTNRTQ